MNYKIRGIKIKFLKYYMCRLAALTLCVVMTVSGLGCGGGGVSDSGSNSGSNSVSNSGSESSVGRTSGYAYDAATEALAEAENEGFEEFLDEVLSELLCDNGLAVHTYLEYPENYGIEDYARSIGMYELDEAGSTEDITDLLVRLTSFDRELLTEKHKLSYDELEYYLTTELEYSDLYLYNTALSTSIGEQIQLPIILAEYSFREMKDVWDYLDILESVDEYFENICEFERLRADAGIFMEDYLADKIIAQCESFAAQASDGMLIDTFKARLDSLLAGDSDTTTSGTTSSDTANSGATSTDTDSTSSASDSYSSDTAYSNTTTTSSASDNYSSDNVQITIDSAEYDSLIARNQTAVDEHVVSGYQILIDGLEELKGSGQYTGGLCNYPDGTRYYEYYLRYNLGWSKTLDEYIDLLSEYTSDTLAQMRSIIAKHPSSYANASAFAFQELTPTETLNELRERIADSYPDGPDVGFSVNYVDSSLSEWVSPAFYFTPQIDNPDENSIYINSGSTSSDELYPTLAHEGFPGHLYQMTYFAATEPDIIRYVLTPTGFAEGWATYAEVDSYRYADTGDEYLNELMGLNYAYTLLVYANVDIGVNYRGMSEDDVYSYLISAGFTASKSLVKEMYDSMVSEPGNYCRYVLGYIAILELKSYAEELLGDRFDTKEFNTFILDTGAIQFDILFDRLESWAESVLGK